MRGARSARAVWLAGLLFFTIAGPANGQGYFDDVGFTALQARLGANTPTGAGVPVAQIEALVAADAYLPDAAAFPNTTITDRSGNGLVSGHATDVGRNFFGSTQSMAPGITAVDAYRVDGSLSNGDWLGETYLRFGSVEPPRVEPHRVQNHSYIGTAPAGDAEATQLLRRYDLAIRRDNIVAVVGVNNNTGAIPVLQSSGYNSIAVGRTDGGSSVGPTTFAESDGVGAGRSKPDIVAPLSATSWATPVVSAAAALLIQTADAKSEPGEQFRAGRAETIKAVLLSGATKAEFAGLAQPWQRTNNGSFVEPLDRRFGAGELNIDNSHRILSAAEQNGADLVSDAAAGWDYESFNSVGESRRYYIDVPADSIGTVSATANWLRQVTQVDANTFTATLSRMELRLYETDGAGNLGSLVDASLSPIDNVQHLYADLLPGQRYALEILAAAFADGQTSEDVAVAWLATFTPVPEPGGVLLGVFVIAAVRLGRRRDRKMEPPVA